MANFILVQDGNEEWILNLDKVNRIVPVAGNANQCNIFLDESNEESGDVPITVEVSFQSIKSVLNLV
jgi:hypothetical protein